MTDEGAAARDAQLMQRALREGRKGRPSPNPHVGALVARGDEVIATGHHARCGGPHAEVVALGRAGERARGATLYVTFEPCNHQGRTGPCTEAIIASGIERIVIGCPDPAPHVAGSARKLARAGIEVVMGVEREPAEALIADFRRFIVDRRPYITLKAAVTLDGKLATRAGDSKWITSERARKEAHRLRAQSDAVMVGIGTVLADDPELTVRMVRGKDPLRVVLDGSLRTPPKSKLARGAAAVPTLIFHGAGISDRKRRALERLGLTLVQVPTDRRGRLRLSRVLHELAKRDVVRLLVEGGAQLHGALLDAGLADRAAVFVAPRILGDADAPSLAAGKARRRMDQALDLEAVETRRLGPDLLITGDIRRT